VPRLGYQEGRQGPENWELNLSLGPKMHIASGELEMRTVAKMGCLLRTRRWTPTTGAELVEMAFVLPILLSLMLGIVWMGRAYNIYETMTRAAREGARVAAASSCATCGNTAAAVGNVENAVMNSLSASNIDTTKVTIPTCGGNLSSKVCYLRNFQMNNTGDVPIELGVVVSLSYQVTFPIPFVTIAPITVTARVQMRQES
jgi:Flp pilus assembly protein TadG